MVDGKVRWINLCAVPRRRPLWLLRIAFTHNDVTGTTSIVCFLTATCRGELKNVYIIGDEDTMT